MKASDRQKDPGAYAAWWINNLSHTKGKWAREAFNLRPWQIEQIIKPLFGTLRPDGLRQYRTCYVEIPRKNGKTELVAAIGLYMLCGDGEPGAEVYSAACDLEQASLAFNVAAQMVRNDPEGLGKVLEVIPSRRRIIHTKSGSVYRAIPAEAPSAHGYNASAVLCDELHAWKTRALFDVLRTSTGARQQPLTVIITTAGWDRTSVCWEQHKYAEQVRDGIFEDPTYLPVLFGAPEDADWQDEGVWQACNPALGDFRGIDEMRMTAARAKAIPAEQNSFRQLYLCQWTQQANRAIDMGAWDACLDQTVSAENLRGHTCYAGIDLASTLDMTALVLVFPRPGGHFAVLSHFYIPQSALAGKGSKARDAHLAEILAQWGREGLITVTPTRTTDYAYIRRDIERLNREFHLAEIAIDRWNATETNTKLAGEGFTVIEFGQGFSSMAAPTKEFLRLVAEGKLQHDGNPVLRWMANNFCVAQDAQGNLKPDKENSSEKIDGIVATIMGLDRASRDPNAGLEAPMEAILGEPRTSARVPW